MIRIKFEVEEPEETPLPIENENERIKRILSLKFFGNNLDNVGGGSTSGLNDGNISGTLMSLQKSPEKNGVVPKKFFPMKKKHLDNSTTDSIAVGSKSIKTEPVESSLSLTTQLNNSLNIQSLLRQNRIQNGWTTNEQSIPIGTQQQQQQSLLLPKIEPIVPEIHQEVSLSLDLSSLISNLDSEQTANCDTSEVPFLDQGSSIPIGTQQQQSYFLPKIEPIVSEIHQEVSLSLDLSSLISNLDSEETANCDTAEIPSLVQSSSSIPIGTEQQHLLLPKIEPIVTEQQQPYFLLKIEPIVPEIHQEVPLSLDLSSLISNLDFEETVNCDTAEIPSLVQSSSSIPNGTEQQQYLLLPKIEPIVPEIHQEVPLSLDLSSLIPNLDSEETVNCDTSEVQFLDQGSSIPNGTQQQQYLLLPKIEPIVPEIHQEVPLSLDLSSLIPNLDSEQTANCDTAEIPSLVQSSSLIPNGTQQEQSLLLPKIEPIVPESQEVPLSLDLSSSLIPNRTQQQQSFRIPKIEPIVPESQEVPLSLDLSSLIPNLDSEQTANCDTAEIPSLVQSSSLIPNGTQQEQSLLLPKIEPIVPESQEVPLSLDLSSSLIPNRTQQQQSFRIPKIEPIVPESQEVPLSLDLSSSLISIGTQQQQSLLSNKFEPIVSEIHKEVPLSLDLSSLIPNLDSEETANCDTSEVPLLNQGSLIPIGTEQQQSFLLPKIEPIVPDNQEVPLSLDSEETANCDTAEIPYLVQSSSLIPIGTEQQQSYFLPKIEPIVPDNQEVPLSLDLSSLIPNLDFEETANCDTSEVPLLDQIFSSIPIEKEQQQSFLLPKIEPIVPEIHQEVPLSLDLSSLIPNLDSEETANCDTVEIQSLVQSSSLIPIGTQQQQYLLLPKIEPIVAEIHQEVPSLVQSASIPIGTQQQQSYFLPKIESIVPEIHQEVPLSLDLSSSSIPIGTEQQQYLLLPKIEPIVTEIHQEVPLSLDQCSLIQNLVSEETAEIPSLVHSASIPIGTQQQQQHSLLLPKIDQIVPEIYQEVPLLFDQSSSSILNSNSGDATNCDITTREFLGPRAGLGRRAKLKVCFEMPKKPEPIHRRRKKLSKEPPPPPTTEPSTTIPATIQRNSTEADNSESTNNKDNYNNYSDQNSGFGSISGLDPSTAEMAAPAAAVPLLVGKKPLRRVPFTLEEKKARKSKSSRLRYLREKAIPKQPVDPEVRAEKLRQRREYSRKWRQQLLARATPEQREQFRLKEVERFRRQKEKESEEQRQRRKERMKQYRTLIKQSLTPEEREKIRLKDLERVRRRMENETDEQRERRLEQKRQYARTVGKQRMELKQRQTMTLEERSAIETNKSLEEQTSMSSETSFNLVVDNSGKSSTNSTKKMKKVASNLNRTTIVSKKKRKPRKKRYELSMSIDSDSSHFEIDCETTNTLVESSKPGPSKLPDRSARRCQRNLKSKIYLEPSTDTDTDLDVDSD